MIAATVENKVNFGVKFGAVFVAGWIGCSAFYGTLDLHKKEATLQSVQGVVIPKLATELKQANCDKTKLRHVAAEAIAANETPDLPSPDWDDLTNCPKVKPVRAPPSITAKN